jgi:hypothetical protein
MIFRLIPDLHKLVDVVPALSKPSPLPRAELEKGRHGRRVIHGPAGLADRPNDHRCGVAPTRFLIPIKRIGEAASIIIRDTCGGRYPGEHHSDRDVKPSLVRDRLFGFQEQHASASQYAAVGDELDQLACVLFAKETASRLAPFPGQYRFRQSSVGLELDAFQGNQLNGVITRRLHEALETSGNGKLFSGWLNKPARPR